MVVASVEDGLQVLASRGIKLKADVLIAEVADKTYDLVVLPGMTQKFASFGAVTGSVPKGFTDRSSTRPSVLYPSAHASSIRGR